MTSKPRYPKHRNIFRIETGNTRGWQVRIERNRRSHSKLFSDTVCGSVDQALEAALKWRDAMLAKLPDPIPTTVHLHLSRNKRRAAEAMNRTGVIGIGFTTGRRVDGQVAPYVNCHWRDAETGRRKSSSYSIRKHGLRGATQKAIARLREGKGERITKSQVDYQVRKALPALRALYEAAMGEPPER